MMDLFWYILHKNLVACLLIPTILVFRYLFKKAPKKTISLIWFVLLIQLFSYPFIETKMPVMPERIVTREQADYYEDGYLEPVRVIREDHYEFVTALESGIHPQVDESGTKFVTVREDSLTNPRKTQIPWVDILFWVWIIGVAAVNGYGLVSYCAIRRKTAQSLEIKPRTYICDEIDSPFALGVFHPRVYLPSGLEKEYYGVICRHENMHIHRLDTLWKWVGFAMLAISWFNPFYWIAYHCFCVDLENACDEMATEDLEKEEKGLYCRALLECGLKQRSVFVAPLYFGETNVLGRVKAVLHGQRPLRWMKTCLGIFALVTVLGLTLKPQAQAVSEESNYDSMWSGERHYVDTKLGTYAEAKRNEANAKWDGETEVPGICEFLGEIKLCSNQGHEIELAVYHQYCRIMDKEEDYIWWAQREGEEFTAAKDTHIRWQVPGLSDFYSYYGTGTLSEFFEKIIQPRLNTAFDVVYNTVEELDLSAYQIQYPEEGKEHFVYGADVLNMKLRAYAEQCRIASYEKWDGTTEIPGQAQCLGEVWLEYGNSMVQYLVYSQKAELQGKEYTYLWWASNTTLNHTLPYERSFEQASDVGAVWQAPGLSETYSYTGLADLKSFMEQILLPQIVNGLDVTYNTVSDLDLSEYTVTHPEGADKLFAYNKPVYDRMLASFAEHRRVEANAKWNGTTEIAGKSNFLGEVFLKFNTDQIHYGIYDQQAWLNNQEYHYIWWCRSFREQEDDKTCYREYHDGKEDHVIWQAPGLSEDFGYFGCADLTEFKEKVLMKDIESTYDVIYNSVSDLDLKSYTYPREENQNEISEEELKSEKVEAVLKTSAQYEDLNLGAYSMQKRRESLMKWDFLAEIPVKCEYRGEIELQKDEKTTRFMLFRQYCDLEDKMFCYIWWTRKDTDKPNEVYSEARDTGLLWHPEELDEYFSYYGVQDEQEFMDKVLNEELKGGMKVISNTVKELKLD